MSATPENPQTSLPLEISREFRELSGRILHEPNPTIEKIAELLFSSAAAMLIERTVSDISNLNQCFTPSGPGGFWRSEAAKNPNGSRIKVHLFPDSASYSEDPGPHSHSSIVVSTLRAGAIINNEFEFQENSGKWQQETFVTAAHLDRSTIPQAQGHLRSLDSATYQTGDLYTVNHRTIHSSEPALGKAAITLCYFGPLIAPGARYRSLDATISSAVAYSDMLKPAEIIKGLSL